MFNFAEYVSWIGNIEVMTFLFSAGIFYVWYAQKKSLAYMWATSVVLTVGATFILKILFHIPRPLTALIVEDGFRFPSGHASTAAIFGILIVYTIFTLYTSRTARAVSIIFACTWFACVAWSRLFLGVHYPVDIIGSLVVAGFSFYTSWKVVKVYFPEKKNYKNKE